jgi:hypothetical protein
MDVVDVESRRSRHPRVTLEGRRRRSLDSFFRGFFVVGQGKVLLRIAWQVAVIPVVAVPVLAVLVPMPIASSRSILIALAIISSRSLVPMLIAAVLIIASMPPVPSPISILCRSLVVAVPMPASLAILVVVAVPSPMLVLPTLVSLPLGLLCSQ